MEWQWHVKRWVFRDPGGEEGDFGERREFLCVEEHRGEDVGAVADVEVGAAGAFDVGASHTMAEGTCNAVVAQAAHTR